MITLQTAVELPIISKKLSYRQGIMMLGSCFTENIGRKLHERCFSLCLNPHGILYNPASIANSIDLIIQNREFTADDLFLENGLWSSFSHHGSFSAVNQSDILKNINISNRNAYSHLSKVSHLFITFGTSWVFATKNDGKIVANCHKLPAKEFNRYRLDLPKMVEVWKNIIEKLKTINPDIHIVLTISPIRHLKDGAFENQVSKSALFMLVAELLQYFGKEIISYFPSYEIVMDELRDYRFYANDLTHLSDTAIAIVNERFEKTFFDNESTIIAHKIDKLVKATQHKPLHGVNKNYIEFVKNIEIETKNLASDYPFVVIEPLLSAINSKKLI